MNTATFVVLFCCLAAFATAHAAPQTRNIIQTKFGLVKGIDGPNGTAQYLGVPFAKPPVGPLRLRSPLPPSPWSGVLDASQYSAGCIQPPSDDAKTFSEDCLYLNVIQPASVVSNPAGPKKGVMIWIYGGSFRDGSTEYPLYNGVPFAVNHDVVFVSINYRLGFLGYGGSDLLRKYNTPTNSTGNFGLEDQRMAVQWVRDNIAQFGGDPDRIFLFGQSAGSASISSHLVSPLSKGLIAAAGLESGPEASWIAKTMEVSNKDFDVFIDQTKCKGLIEAGLITCILDLSTDEIATVEKHLPPSFLWGPVIDGVNLLKHPVNSAMAGEWSNVVPLLMGTNQDEGTLFIEGFPLNITEEVVVGFAEEKFGTWAPRVLAEYPVKDYQSPWWQLATTYGQTGFNCPARRTARWATAAGMPVYVYYFTHVPQNPVPGCIGVCHFAEVPFVFDTHLIGNVEEQAMSDAMSTFWASMAVGQNPNTLPNPSGVKWPMFQSQEPQTYLNINTPKITTVTDLLEEKCQFWDAYLAAFPLAN